MYVGNELLSRKKDDTRFQESIFGFDIRPHEQILASLLLMKERRINEVRPG